jgi:LPXTG-motif cell wall-anchored protein
MPGAGDDSDQLPFTGSDGLLLVAGGLLLVVGGTLLVAARRLPPG